LDPALTTLAANPRIRRAAVACVLLAACAKSPAATPPAPPVDAPASTPVGAPLSSSGVRINSTFERIWAALPRAYAAVGITVNAIDTATRAVGFGGLIRKKLGDTPLSTYFECGTQIGPNADSYDITLVVASQVGRDPKTSQLVVTTGLRISARSPAFASTTTICTSKGELERRLMAALRAEVER